MDEQLFKDLMQVIKCKKNLNDVIDRYCTDDQIKKHEKVLVSTLRKLADTNLKEEADRIVEVKYGKIKRGSDHTGVTLQKEVVFGGFGHEAAAQASAIDFERPTIFDYQTAVFPNPKAFGVKVTIKAKPKKLPKPESELYPWSVILTVKVEGEKADQWFKSFLDRTRGVRL